MGFAHELSQIALAQCGGQMDEAVTFCVNNASARVQEFQESRRELQQQEGGGSGGGELLAPAENKEGQLEPANSEIKGPTSRSHRLSSASKLAELEPLHCGSSVLGMAKAEDCIEYIEAGASAPAMAKTEDDTGAGASCPGKTTSAEPFAAEPKSTDSNILEAKVSNSVEDGFRLESSQLPHLTSSGDIQLQDQKSVSSQGSKGQSQSNTCILC
uniref:UBA domain-containing protein n=1 Tax=Heterosigma akashiwo TaxID=2829 RepID=A0A7S3XZA4_HETAK